MVPTFRDTETLHWDWNPRKIFFLHCGLCFCNLAKTRGFVMMPFFCHAYFPRCINHLHWDSEPGEFLGDVAFVVVICLSNQLWPWHCSSTLLCFRVTETTFSGNWTWTLFGALTVLKSLVSRNKDWSCGRLIYPLLSYNKQTYISTI